MQGFGLQVLGLGSGVAGWVPGLRAKGSRGGFGRFAESWALLGLGFSSGFRATLACGSWTVNSDPPS